MGKTSTLKNVLRFSMLAIAVMAFSFRSSALVLPSSTPEPVKKESTAVSPLSKLSVDDFLSLTPKKIREMTGQKMSISQKVALKLAQNKLKNDIRTKQKADVNSAAAMVDGSDFNIGGFVLGLLLSIIGVLIAYLIGDRDVIKWAWIGFGVSAIIYLLILII
ncbi:MAG: hypothetical protein H0X41_05170 [Chitinophagaceae bacterium]|nr:hypothetical protein [Chitinophagaceae bacterium]